MSLEREEFQEVVEVPDQDAKVNHHNTTKCLLSPNSPSLGHLDWDSMNTASDTSFEMSMHQQNMENILETANSYLATCLTGPYHSQKGFKDASLYKMKTFEIKGESDLDCIINHNWLLSKQMLLDVQAILQKQDGILGLIRQAPAAFGITVAKELVYVIYHIYSKKVDSFHLLLKTYELFLPKMHAFVNSWDELPVPTGIGCPVYEDISPEEVMAFAEKDIEPIANHLYFSDIRILNLKDVSYETKMDVNIIQQFSKLIKQISKAVFLSAIGATEPPAIAGLGLELSRTFSFADFSEGGPSLQNSLSRPFVSYDEEESYDLFSKKIKFE